jgi:hypothetical protein
MTSTHNLDINTYSLEEIFGLFDLNYNLTENSMRAAKKKVLMIHPDKSRLPANYFLFYKQAYEIVLNIYKQKSKFNGDSKSAPQQYTPDVEQHASIGNNEHTNMDANISKKFSNSKFNELYDQNMVRKTDTSRFDWFKQDEPVIDDFSKRQVNPKNMGSELEAIKQKQAALQVYKGVQEMQSGGGTSYFEDDGESNEYVACDVFSKLKFDDLRKVHKDQTVFAVSEADFNKRPQYKTVDQFVRERDAGGSAPLSKTDAAQLLERQQKEKEQLIMNKQHRDYMLQKEYEEKQKSVRAAFLQLR